MEKRCEVGGRELRLKYTFNSICAVEERAGMGDDAGRNALGERVVDRVAVKRVIALSWAHLSSAQLALLLQAVTAEVFFSATYPDPLTGAPREAVCRAVEKSGRVFRADGASPEWAEIAMKWEER